MIDRYEIVSLLPERTISKKNINGDWCKSQDVEKLEKQIKELENEAENWKRICLTISAINIFKI